MTGSHSGQWWREIRAVSLCLTAVSVSVCTQFHASELQPVRREIQWNKVLCVYSLQRTCMGYSG